MRWKVDGDLPGAQTDCFQHVTCTCVFVEVIELACFSNVLHLLF